METRKHVAIVLLQALFGSFMFIGLLMLVAGIVMFIVE